MGNTGKSIYRRSLERAIDEKRIMMADERCPYISKREGTKATDNKPNDMTPIAWKIPLLMVKRGVLNVPLDSFGTMKPWVTTVNSMMTMLINASVLAFASYLCQLSIHCQ